MSTRRLIFILVGIIGLWFLVNQARAGNSDDESETYGSVEVDGGIFLMEIDERSVSDEAHSPVHLDFSELENRASLRNSSSSTGTPHTPQTPQTQAVIDSLKEKGSKRPESMLTFVEPYLTEEVIVRILDACKKNTWCLALSFPVSDNGDRYHYSCGCNGLGGCDGDPVAGKSTVEKIKEVIAYQKKRDAGITLQLITCPLSEKHKQELKDWLKEQEITDLMIN